MKHIHTFESFLNEFGPLAGSGNVRANQLDESQSDVIFSVDDDKLDQMLNARFSRQLDYKDDRGDSLYVLPKREFDRFLDLADSSGFDVDYENSEDSVIYVQESLDEGLAAVDREKLTNRMELTQQTARTLMNNAKAGKLKHMRAGSGTTHYWNPKTGEYIGRTEQSGRLNKGTFFYSDALDADGNLNEKIEYPEGVKTTDDNILDKLAKLLNSPKGIIEVGSGSVRGKKVPFQTGDAYFNITGYRDHWNILCSNGDFEIPRKEIKNAEELYDQLEKAIQMGTVTIGKKK